jgi:hypothetical protein
MEGEKRRTLTLLGPLDRVGVLFSPSIHLRKETEPASETLYISILIF